MSNQIDFLCIPLREVFLCFNLTIETVPFESRSQPLEGRMLCNMGSNRAESSDTVLA